MDVELATWIQVVPELSISLVMLYVVRRIVTPFMATIEHQEEQLKALRGEMEGLRARVRSLEDLLSAYRRLYGELERER